MPGRFYRRAVDRRRRSLQLRVVATTLVVSAVVVVIVGLLVASQVRDSVLTAKVNNSLAQSDKVITTFNASFASASSRSEPLGLRVALSAAVQAAYGNGSNRYPVALVGTGPAAVAENTLGGVDVDATINPSLAAAVGEASPGAKAWQYVRIHYETDNGSPGGRRAENGLAVVESVTLPGVGAGAGGAAAQYRLYQFYPLTNEASLLNQVQLALLLGGAGLILLFAGIAWLVTRQIVKPVQHTARIAEMLAAGRLQERLAIRGVDELAKLGTSFNKMADSLQRQIRELEDLSRLQRRFVSDVSHELRTPLTTIRMAADVLHAARVDFPPAVARSAELLQHELDRFEGLLVDLLEISRHDARAAVLEAESVDVGDLVESIVERSQSHSESTGCPLELQLPDEQIFAEIDPRRIQRIVRNLINNALDHGENQPVRVSVASSDDAVAISVRDYGVGLRPGESTLVFNRFWRADAARARSSGGTGLGLAISLEDARLHGGWLQAWGEVGHGSNFRLTLPRRAGAELTSSPLPLEPDDAHRPVDSDDSSDKTTTQLLRPTPPPVTMRGIGQPRPADTTTPGAVRG